jgi:hypothetical protein
MKNKKIYYALILIILVVVAIFGIKQVRILNVAHSSFDNYYRFRGCEKLIEKTDTYGTCTTYSGERIKIVLISGKWYLEGDGPGIW